MDPAALKKLIALELKKKTSLNDIHRLLRDQHGQSMTFMELRLLAAEAEIDWKELDPVKPEAKKAEDADDSTGEAQPAGTVVEMSKIARPGAMLSGSVSFASGLKGEWWVDNAGRLGMNMADKTTRPSPEEMMEFQRLLEEKVYGAQGGL
ncbi:MAG: hypothetical protein RL095_1964 [Verrucomicrobiota bacterium]|jgi:hypothetical protein